MSIIKSNSIATKIAIGVMGVAFAFALLLGSVTQAQAALTTSQVNAIIALLESFGADAVTVANVQASLTGGTPTVPSGGGSTASVCPYTWATSLTNGSTGADVLALQQFLNSDSATVLGTSGAGSPGNETSYFGSITKAGVVKFQDKYASEVLTPVGLSAGTGYFGSSSRAKANSLCAVASTPTTPTTPGTPTTPATGTGLSVVAGVQPAATLAPDSAARVPFTTFIVTAGSDGDVVMDNVSIERTGLAPNAVFAGIVLLDSDGVQIGTSKTLNSNNQATVGSKVTIPAGTSKIFTIAGNMASDNDTRDGTIATLSVIGINTSATVTGSLPIVGTAQTINASLAIGSVTMAISSFDPSSAQSKEIGTTGVRFAGITVTAGSSEDVRINNIRWNQTGSAGSSDLANVVTVVDGVEYPAVISSDGKFFTSIFGSGVVVLEGNLVDIYIKGDIVGGSGRTAIFDIDKTTDLNITGETFGYGITPPTTGTISPATANTNAVSAFTTGTPWFNDAIVSITAGSVTSIQKASSVAAQNIAVNVSNQPLGGFETDIKGEAINISGMTLVIATSTGGTGIALLTNVTIVDQNGTVVAGPVDATNPTAADQDQSVIFTDSMTLPIGKMVYTVRGKVGSDASNSTTYITEVTPSGWTSPVGDVTGDTITIGQGMFTLNTMTVKSSALAISISSSPVAQNITAGAQDFLFANVQFDASQSGEDVRFSSIKLAMTYDVTVTEVTGCILFDGAVPLNTGSNALNPSESSDTNETFTFDNSLTVSKGTIKTLALRCDVASTVAETEVIGWGINSDANPTVTGVISSNTVAETIADTAGPVMTVAAVTVVVSKDSSSPSYAIASAGSTGVIAGVAKFRASNEAVTLQRIGLKLTNSASSSSSDLVQVSIWDGITKVGTAIFVGANENATSTLDIPVTLPKDTDKTLTIKIDLANIGSSQTGTQGALLSVDIDLNTNTQGIGQESGTTVDATGSAAFDGIRMFKSKPTFAKIAIPSTALVTSTMDLYRFSVTADSAGSIGIYKFTVNIATSSSPITASTTVSNLKVKAYTDANFSTTVSGFSPAGQLNDSSDLTDINGGDNDVLFSASTQSQDTLQIPAGATYYFRVIATVALTGSPTSGSITTSILGDANYPVIGTSPYLESTASSTSFTNAAGNDFIWSPNATTTSDITHQDWTNGYFVSGLPSDNMDQAVIVK